MTDRGPGGRLLWTLAPRRRFAAALALLCVAACTDLHSGDGANAGEPDGGLSSEAGITGGSDARASDPRPPPSTDAGTRAPDAATPGAGSGAPPPDAATQVPDAAQPQPDAAPSCESRTFFKDGDGDGYGDPAQPIEACEQPAQTSTTSDDCDDGCSDCHPGGSETCDGTRDENCSQTVDEGCACAIGSSRDCGEDRGVCEFGAQSCSDSGTWSVSCVGGRGPDPSELCGNNLDDDCDGNLDEAPGPGLCCIDDHCNPGQKCGNAGSCVAKTWCELRARPGDVTAADYQCLDFEPGLPGAPWTQSNSGGGMLITTTAEASSAPNSLFASTSAGSSDTHVVQWSNTGAAAIKSISIAADIHPRLIEGLYPAWDPSVTAELLCVSPSSRRYCLSYIIGDHPDYIGLVFEQWAFDGGVSFLTCPITMDPAEGIWSRIELRVSTTADPQVLVNGAVRSAADCNMRMGPSTTTGAQVGMKNNGAAGWGIHIDNAEVQIRR